MLGISLVWKSASPSINVHLDLRVTLLNRESFHENQHFVISNAQYSMSSHDVGEMDNKTSNGNRAFISIAELISHRPRFVDTNGEFQIELRVSKIRTFFQNMFTIHSKMTDFKDQERQGSCSSFDYEAMEVQSELFVFGGFVWKAVLSPQPQLLTTSWAAAAASVSTVRRKALKLQPRSKHESIENTDICNLGINVALQRKSVKLRGSVKSPKSSITQDSSITDAKNKLNNMSHSVNSPSDANFGNGNDIAPGQSNDDLLARLTYKVL